MIVTHPPHLHSPESPDALVCGAVHDFRNLLVAVMGNAELILRDLGPSSPHKQGLQVIVSAAEMGAELCKRLLASVRPGRLKSSLLDLSTLVQEAIELLDVRLTRNVNLVLDLDTQLPTIQGDVTQLRQVAINLLANACQAIEDFPGCVVVRTGQCTTRNDFDDVVGMGDRLQEHVFLEVSDNGHGMDEETKRRLFMESFTTKPANSGLGLTSVKAILEQHQGVISFQSEAGRGTTFRVVLPCWS